MIMSVPRRRVGLGFLLRNRGTSLWLFVREFHQLAGGISILDQRAASYAIFRTSNAVTNVAEHSLFISCTLVCFHEWFHEWIFIPFMLIEMYNWINYMYNITYNINIHVANIIFTVGLPIVRFYQWIYIKYRVTRW